MVEALLWLALLSPLQLVLLGHSANQVIGNLSLLGLMLLRMVGKAGLTFFFQNETCQLALFIIFNYVKLQQ